jgi:SAM-dependent methyltransferase
MSTRVDRIAARIRAVRPAPVWAALKDRLQSRLVRAGYLVAKLDEESIRYLVPSHDHAIPLPPGAEETLRADHPRLAQLRAAYEALDYPTAVPTQWNDSFLRKNLSLPWFRGDNAYVWQLRQHSGSAAARNYLAMLDVQSRDRLALLDRLTEDGLFGAWTYTFGTRPAVSRDLLDSVNEINYLDDHIGLGALEAPTVLDIGAGYGRLAHRMAAALPNLAGYDCTDGVAVSTFLCEYYLAFRNVPTTIRVIPLSEIERLADRYTVAVNVHSFAECSRTAICWWLDRIAEHAIEWLLIVAHTQGELLSTELGGSRRPYLPDVLAAGYELADNRPVYQSDELRELIGVHDEFFLFHRSAVG